MWRYPIKSMGGERVDSLELRVSAIVGDRRWAVRNIETGKIASAKRPRPYGQLLDWSANTQVDGRVIVTAPTAEVAAAGTIQVGDTLVVPD